VGTGTGKDGAAAGGFRRCVRGFLLALGSFCGSSGVGPVSAQLIKMHIRAMK